MKRSTGVQLILLGSAMGLHGCDGTAHPLQQQRYTSFEQCRRDWGDPADCKQSQSGGMAAYYFGPRYYWDAGSGRPVAVEPDGSTRGISSSRITGGGSQSGGVTEHVGSISRGGFGASARGFGGGGG
jgi:hypothetical protein